MDTVPSSHRLLWSVLKLDHIPTSLYPFQNKYMFNACYSQSTSDYFCLCGLLQTWMLREASYFAKVVENGAEVFISALFLRPVDCNSFLHCS